MQQLVKQDSELASSVMSNAGTRICFRIGDADAKRFEDGFSFFEAQDLQNLNTGEAIVRIDRPEFDFSLTTESLPEATMNEELRNRILSESRTKYGTTREVIEQILSKNIEEFVEDQKQFPPAVIQKEEKRVEPLLQEEKIKVPAAPISESGTAEKFIKQKEQSQHRYLQMLIKRMAESRGYKALIEEPTPDGKGRVDVSLERNGKRIAIEISVTTEDVWEVHNIEKCLSAQYDFVVACSTEKKTLENIRKKAEELLDPTLLTKLLFFQPEDFFLYLDREVAKEASTETRMKGYRVKVEYDPLSESDRKSKESSIANVILSSKKNRK